MSTTMQNRLVREGWTPSVTYVGDEKRCGLISEDHAPTMFVGEYHIEGQKVDSKLPVGSRVLEGLLQRANTMNRNRRIYSSSLLDRETKAMSESLKESGGILGELDHPETVTINLQKACQRIDRLNFNKDGIVEGRIVLLPELPLGRAAIGIADALGGKAGQSSRGAGTLYQKGDAIMVGEDYRMRTYDMVHDPSTYGARPTSVEEQQRQATEAQSLIREFTEYCQSRPSTRDHGLADLVDRWLGLK
jgi:hypothetical protein